MVRLGLVTTNILGLTPGEQPIENSQLDPFVLRGKEASKRVGVFIGLVRLYGFETVPRGGIMKRRIQGILITLLVA